MPLGIRRLTLNGKSKAKSEKAEDGGPLDSTDSNQKLAPPEYAATDPLPKATIDELTAGFANLDIAATPRKFPDVDTTLAHLKLLEAFFALKEETGYTDGLFDLWDSRAQGAEDMAADVDPARRRQHDEAVSKIREKRWILYVLRAVDRFEAWWAQVLSKRDLHCHALRQVEMCDADFAAFPSSGTAQTWSTSMLPPLDVLMVWHTFMLNPRAYLEDCMRFGLKDTYATGMPWQTVNAAIDTQFNYSVPQAARDGFTNMTGRSWDNIQDSSTKSLKCPKCSRMLAIPWTTCGFPEHFDPKAAKPGLVGNGYGEKDFSFYCDGCGAEVNHDLLRVAKFKRHVEILIRSDCPMPGTILFGTNGVPQRIPKCAVVDFPNTFPNRLLLELKFEIVDLLTPSRNIPVTMNDIRGKIETAILSTSTVRKVNSRTRTGRGALLRPEERLAIRKMMSRYWDNHESFALELGGAVLRQGTFVDKMHGLDWLHSPTARATMGRLLTKYDRFMSIIAAHPKNVAVPTLDVDLAWHTHQLSPQSYFNYSVAATRDRFVDHDDKIEEDKLSEAFEWTSKVYEKDYGQVYSECSCWYCEAIRAKHVSTSSKLLGRSKHEKITDTFHSSGVANMCPPDKSAHISSHNAMPADRGDTRDWIWTNMQKVKKLQLDRAYEKACKQAQKKGRPVPKKERYVEDHWGYGYYGYYPYTGAYLWMTPYLYFYPMYIPMGAGMYGACAGGTCGGGVAAGGCGGSGGCGGGCSAGAGGCGGGGGGGVGGGCGGGGGGGGGGGCGGGGGGGGGGGCGGGGGGG
ncbi:MAG: hypothetical protein M1818_006770 [Claussenomyces sp. TS43310]|nr:MAG: hypothetical protein M1818_006770 [Claussenomyces sp. TS43310]